MIGRTGGGLNESFTVRKISYGEGVERVFPVCSPMVEKVEVVRRGKVRRAKLYYLRGLRGKSARIGEASNVRAKKLNEDMRDRRRRTRRRAGREGSRRRRGRGQAAGRGASRVIAGASVDFRAALRRRFCLGAISPRRRSARSRRGRDASSRSSSGAKSPRRRAAVEEERVRAAELDRGRSARSHGSSRCSSLIAKCTIVGLESPTPSRGFRSVEPSMKAGWIAPSMTSIGPDCVAKRAAGFAPGTPPVSITPAVAVGEIEDAVRLLVEIRDLRPERR